MSEWKEVRLGDVCEIVGGGTPSTKKDEYWNGDISWLTPKDLSNYDKKYIYRGERSITQEGLEKSSAKLLPKGTILFTSRAPIGYVAIAGKEVCTNQGFKSLICKDKAYNQFIYYVMKFKTDDIIKVATGSTFKEISGNGLKSIKIHLPPLLTQKKIADILSVIDEKIETLQNINSTLEEMAKTIFKSWFVDFDITKAKVSGKSDDEIAKEFGINREIIQLFPSEFETSEIGEIPKGWEVRKINEISNIGIGKTPPRKEKECFTTNKNDIKWVSIKDMGNSNMFIFNTNEYLTKEAIKKYNIKIVPKNSVLLSFKLTLGRVSITSEEMVTNEAIAHFIIDNNSITSTEYIYLYLKTFNFDKLGNTSSIARAVNSKVVKNIPILISDNIIIKIFNKITAPIFQNIENNTQQIQTLQQTRDTLLPKLINKEIEVDELDIRGIE